MPVLSELSVLSVLFELSVQDVGYPQPWLSALSHGPEQARVVVRSAGQPAEVPEQSEAEAEVESVAEVEAEAVAVVVPGVVVAAPVVQVVV